jgi:hypothetical protein
MRNEVPCQESSHELAGSRRKAGFPPRRLQDGRLPLITADASDWRKAKTPICKYSRPSLWQYIQIGASAANKLHSERPQQIDRVHDSDALKCLEPSEVMVKRNDQVGVPGDRAFENPVVIGIGLDDVQPIRSVRVNLQSIKAAPF